MTAAHWPVLSFAASCEPPVAKIVSVQGHIEARKAPETEWQPARLNDTYCPGDTIRVFERSRAAIALINETILRLDQNTTVTFTELEGKEVSWLNLLTGAIYSLSRVPRTLNIKTPFVNAAIEGTEFFIKVEESQSILTVFEGAVAANNELGRLVVTSGQSAVARRGEALVPRIVVHPKDAVHWALYYPAVITYRSNDFPEEIGWQALVRRSIEFYRHGDLTGAFSAIAAVPEDINDPRFLTYRAALLLTVGRIDEATKDIQNALSIAPRDSIAFALRAIVAVAQKHKDEASELAKKAVELDSKNSAAWIALSYVQQANFDLTAALASVQKAVALSPDDALVLARLSELWLSLGYLNKALKAAKQAVSLNPDLAHTQSVLGFAYLTQIKIQDAMTAFDEAIARDQASPLPRLGLGLAKIRAGNLKDGRLEIEVAACLDPTNSLIRSYLGKAYYEEKRDKLAASQYALAKELDPRDPTPYFYDAIRLQTINRPVEALRNLQKSIELNDNRAVYRSTFLLDEDQAVRGSSLARIYNDLGFEQIALVEGTKSLGFDPANYSAHRFLADAYALIPRHEIARASELLQSQLLQPLNILPVQPKFTQTELTTASRAGPSQAGFNEFTRLFDSNGPRLFLGGGIGNNDSWGDEIIVSGLQGKFSYSVGQSHGQTDGFRDNNDLSDDIYDLFAQVAVTPALNLQTEFRRRESDLGDIDLNFNPDDFSLDDRRQITQDTARLGIHFAPSPQSDVLVSLINSNRDGQQQLFATGAPNVDEQTNTKGNQLEAQYIFRLHRFNVTTGIGTYDVDVDRTSVLDWTSIFGVACPPSPPFPPVPCEEVEQFSRKHDTAYVYANFSFPKRLTWTLGVSYDSLEQQAQNLNKLFPKAGLQWNFAKNMRLRLAYIETLKRALVVNQTIEPTQVAGFNQFYDDINGTTATLTGIALDTTLKHNVSFGLEALQRDLEVPRLSSTTITFTDRSEDLYRAYVYWTPYPRWAVSAEYRFEQFTNEPPDLTEIETTSVPTAVRYFDPSGFFAELGATFVRQEVDATPTPSFDQTEDNFVVVDVGLGYRLPKRRGILSFEVRNLFDEQFLFQDLNFLTAEPGTPPFIPERTVFAKFTLNF